MNLHFNAVITKTTIYENGMKCILHKDTNNSCTRNYFCNHFVKGN